MPLMHNILMLVAALTALPMASLTAYAAHSTVQLGPRPFHLVDQMSEGGLKDKSKA